MNDTAHTTVAKDPTRVRVSGSTLVVNGYPHIVLSPVDAMALFALAIVTEDRDDDEQDALVQLGRWLDENIPAGQDLGWESDAIASRGTE